MNRSSVPVALSAFLFTLLPDLARAQDTVDASLWTQVVATVSLSDNWRLHLEEQPRFNDNVTDVDQNIARWAVGRKMNDRLTLWGGHAWIARIAGPGTKHEHRLWQQASVTLPDAGTWKPSLRFRLEQRFLDGWDDASVRLRSMGRGVRPLDADGTWSLVGWNEVMFTFDETQGGPARGFDQNRLFGGVLRKLNAHAGLEFGYIWQAVNQPAPARDTHSHIAFVWLNLTL